MTSRKFLLFDPPPSLLPLSHSYALCLMCLCHTITNPLPLIVWRHLWMAPNPCWRCLTVSMVWYFCSVVLYALRSRCSSSWSCCTWSARWLSRPSSDVSPSLTRSRPETSIWSWTISPSRCFSCAYKLQGSLLLSSAAVQTPADISFQIENDELSTKKLINL